MVFDPKTTLEEVASVVAGWARDYRHVYIKPNLTTTAPLRGATTEADLMQSLVAALVRPARIIHICESDTSSRTARQAFAEHLTGRIAQQAEFFDLTEAADTIEIVARSGTWSLPSFVHDRNSLFVDVACLKDSKPYRISGPLKNLFGLVCDVEKTRIHKYPVEYLYDLLWRIYGQLHNHTVGIVDGRWQWVGDFDSGGCQWRGLVAASRDLLSLEHWANSRCATFATSPTMLEAKPPGRRMAEELGEVREWQVVRDADKPADSSEV